MQLQRPPVGAGEERQIGAEASQQPVDRRQLRRERAAEIDSGGAGCEQLTDQLPASLAWLHHAAQSMLADRLQSILTFADDDHFESRALHPPQHAQCPHFMHVAAPVARLAVKEGGQHEWLEIRSRGASRAKRIHRAYGTSVILRATTKPLQDARLGSLSVIHSFAHSRRIPALASR